MEDCGEKPVPAWVELEAFGRKDPIMSSLVWLEAWNNSVSNLTLGIPKHVVQFDPRT